jgi:hypothetical protein
MIGRELYAHVFCAVPWNRVISYDPGSKALNEMKGYVCTREKKTNLVIGLLCLKQEIDSLFGVKDHHRECNV